MPRTRHILRPILTAAALLLIATLTCLMAFPTPPPPTTPISAPTTTRFKVEVTVAAITARAGTEIPATFRVTNTSLSPNPSKS